MATHMVIVRKNTHISINKHVALNNDLSIAAKGLWLALVCEVPYANMVDKIGVGDAMRELLDAGIVYFDGQEWAVQGEF